MADDPWAVVSSKPIAATPDATAAAPDATTTTANPWAVVAKAPAAIPTETIRPTAPAPAPVPQTGDVPSQQPQPTGGNFYAGARGAPGAMGPIVQAAAAKHGVPLWVANWVGSHESNWDTSAIGMQTSTGTAKGAWQFMDGTAKEMGLADPHDFKTSTDAAMGYLKKLADKNGGDWTKAVEAYGTFSTGKPHRDAAARAGFGEFMGKAGAAPGGGASVESTDKYDGWDTPGTADEPIEDPEYVPFRDEPGTTRGNILPIARDKEGDYSLAIPDLFRAPVRGVIEGGQEARGIRPVDDPGARSDIAAAAGFGVNPSAKLFTTPEQRAADTLRTYQRTPAGRADKIIETRLNQDVRSGSAQVQPPIEHGPPPVPGAMPPLALTTTPADNVVANLDRMREGGKPATLIDVGGPNVRGLAGSVARKPGAGQGIIRSTMEERDAGAGERAQADVQRYVKAGPSAYRTARDLIGQRSTEGTPLFKKSFEGGSMAPLKDQFEEAFQQATVAEKNAGHDLTYAEQAAQDGSRQSQVILNEARAAWRRAADDKKMVLDKLSEAREDIANGTPGAVWNPRIQQFLDDPITKRGMAGGLETQRLEALANGTRFDPTEYAMTPEGAVIKVPNMRTLHAAKMGLDALIESEGRDEFGRMNTRGRAINEVRKAFLVEIDRVNPDYAKARQSWAGHSASLDALKWGKNINRLHPEEVAEDFAAMSKSEQEFARLGLADTLLERIGKTSFTGDEAKALINNQWTKDQLQPLFKSQADFTKYVETVAHERLMKDTQNRVLAGSQTAERQEESSHNELHAAGHAAHAVGHVLGGNAFGAIRSAAQAYRYLGLRPDEALTEALAKSMTDPARVPNVVGGQMKFPTPTMRIKPGFRWGAPTAEFEPSP